MNPPTARARRLKLIIQVASALTFLLLFGQIFTGMCVQYFSSSALIYGEEPFMVELFDYADLIHGFHRWAGPVMALTIAATGISLILLRREAKGFIANLLRPLGIAVLLLGIAATAFAHGTGVVGGPLLVERDLLSGGSADEGTKALTLGETYVEAGRDPERQEIFDHHLDTAIWLLLLATVVQMLGVMAAGAAVPKARKAAG